MTKKKTLKLVYTDDGYIDPEQLHGLLKVTQIHEMTFRGEKEMQRYRHLLYSINKQGTYRYRTMRSEGSMWAIAIWRMR